MVDNALEDLGKDLRHAGVEHLLGRILMLVNNLAVTVLDLGDGDGIAVVAARGKGGVGLGHLERGDAGDAERERGDVLHVGGNAEVMRGVDDVLVAHGLGDLHVACVGRELGGAGERDGAVALIAVVLDGVRLAQTLGKRVGRVAVDANVGVHALLKGGCKREGLERGAHLTAGDGVVGVMLVGVVVLAAHHGADVARAILDDGHAGLEAVEVVAVELVDDRGLGGSLDSGVDGGVDGKAARENGVVAELLIQEGAHVVDEVGLT